MTKLNTEFLYSWQCPLETESAIIFDFRTSILFTFLTIKHMLNIFTAERNSYCVMALSVMVILDDLTTQERETGVDLSKIVSNMSLFFCVFASQSLTCVLRQFRQSYRFSHTIGTWGIVRKTFLEVLHIIDWSAFCLILINY